MTERIATIIASGFWTGYLPVAPGTWGSAAILPVAALVHLFFGQLGLLVFSAILFSAGIFASQKYIDLDGRADPPEITIDEMAAQVLVLSIVDLWFIDYFFAFLLFRLFDIFKPAPIPLIEQKLPPALAVMLDDTAAAIYAMMVFTIFRFIGFLG